MDHAVLPFVVLIVKGISFISCSFVVRFGAIGLSFLFCTLHVLGGVHNHGRAYKADRILIQPRAGSDEDLAKLRAKKNHNVHKRFIHADNIEVIEIGPNEDPVFVAQEYANSGLVEFAEPDYILRASAVPNDTRFSSMWSLNNTGQTGGLPGADINAPEAWDTRTSAENVIVAVIDSGVRYTHEDLVGNMWRNPREIPNGRDDDGNGIVDDIFGYNAAYNNGDPDDDNGHGTHVAGTIGAVGNNGKGVTGVAWKVQIMACKFLDGEGYGATSDAVACINYARIKGAKVINASWGGPENSSALRNAITAARNAGIIMVVAAGNEESNNDLYPSYPTSYTFNNIVSVAAVNHNDQLDYYSNFGATGVDLAAPGSGILSTWNSSDTAYDTISGTSMATPHVAGAVALLRAAYPAETHTAIISRLFAATDKLPSLTAKCVTGARLNLAKLFPARTTSIDSAEKTSTGTLRLSISSTSGTTRVESSTNLRDWTAVPVSPTGDAVEVPIHSDERCRFYRVLIEN
jgi:subtilisin family serine protease